MKTTNQKRKEEQKELESQVDLDLKFQENLMFYEKHALAHLIGTMAQNESTRRWFLDTLRVTQDLGYTIGLYNGPVAEVQVMGAVRDRLDQMHAEKGPAGLNTMSLEELAEKIANQAIHADAKASCGHNLAALNALLDIAALAVYGIAWQIQHDPVAAQQIRPEAAQKKGHSATAEQPLNINQNQR